jgi:general secretion pathway protein A
MTGKQVASDDRSQRLLADEPGFIGSLTDLDRGVADDKREPGRKGAHDAAPPGAHGNTPSPEVGVSATARAPRRLRDLFPSTESDDTLTISIQPTAAAAPSAPAAPRRAFPVLDIPARRPDPPSAAPTAPAPAPARLRAEKPTPETFFGLQEKAFGLGTDPRFLYHSAAHDRAAQSVLDAIRQRDAVVVLTGAMGLGKTMLCRTVMDQLDRRTLTSLVTNPHVKPEALLKNVLVDFGVISASDVTGRMARASRADLHTALRDFLYSLVPLQAFAVVIIDEAQKLSAELLEEVKVLTETGRDEQLLQMMLVGEPSLSSLLLKSQLRSTFQRASTRVSLGPLAADEISGYVAHRLQVAGASPRVAFDDRAAELLYEFSRGVPRTLNLLCERAMAAARKASTTTIGERFVEAAAEDLDLASPPPKASRLKLVLGILAFFLLVVAGAAVGAYVFRSNVAAWLERWQARPAAPASPAPDLLPAFAPVPPGSLEPGTAPAPPASD